MIRTVTLNTGFDEIFVVPPHASGGVFNVLHHESVPSGKGVNAGRIAKLLESDVVIYGLIGSNDRGQFESRLARAGVMSSLVEIEDITRRNLTLVRDGSGEPASHFRSPGFRLAGRDAVTRLVTQLVRDIQSGDIVSLHGSIPEGIDSSIWKQMAIVAHSRGAVVIVDVQGAPFVDVLESGIVRICKPNEEEILALPGICNERGTNAAHASLRFMNQEDVWLPTVSLGSQGIVYIENGQIWRASLQPVRTVFAVGAGDACMAGMMVALAQGISSPTEIVRWGISAAVTHVEGTSHAEFFTRTKALKTDVNFLPVART